MKKRLIYRVTSLNNSVWYDLNKKKWTNCFPDAMIDSKGYASTKYCKTMKSASRSAVQIESLGAKGLVQRMEGRNILKFWTNDIEYVKKLGY